MKSIFILGLTFCVLSACKKQEREKPAPPAEIVSPLCPTGVSEDPPRSQLDVGIRAFSERDYKTAQLVFQRLAEEFPGSSTIRAWQGDAYLFDKDLKDQEAARISRPYFEEAARLHEQGCTLPRRPRYYQLMGEAYGALRLAKLEAGYDENELLRAEKFLREAATEFSTSAEVPYNLARVYCARALQSEGQPQAAYLDACLEQFRLALEVAERLDRPRFLRTHRSTQDWIVRSRTQSEFVPLRADPRYERSLAETLQEPAATR